MFISATPPSLFTPVLGQTPAVVILTCPSSLPSIQTAEHPGEKHTTWLMSFTSMTAHLKGIPSVSQMSSLDHAGPFAASSFCSSYTHNAVSSFSTSHRAFYITEKSTEETPFPTPHPPTPHTQLHQHPCALPPLLLLWVNLSRSS